MLGQNNITVQNAVLAVTPPVGLQRVGIFLFGTGTVQAEVSADGINFKIIKLFNKDTTINAEAATLVAAANAQTGYAEISGMPFFQLRRTDAGGQNLQVYITNSKA